MTKKLQSKKGLFLATVAVATTLCVGGCLCGCSGTITVTSNGNTTTINANGTTTTTTNTNTTPTAKSYNFTDVSAVEVDLNIGDLIISKGDGFTVTATYPEAYAPTVECTNGKLVVKHNGDFNNVGTNEDWGVVITVPEDYKLSNMDLDLSLGNMTLSDLVVESFKAEDSLGSINMNYCVFQTVNIEADMGDVNGTQIGFASGTIETNMGSIDMNGDFDSITAHSDLGTATVNGKKVS